MKDGFPVSVAELLAAGERPLPSEAAAIVLDVCAQVMRRPWSASVLPAISPAALFLDGSGSIAIAGGVPVEDEQTVLLLGRLLLQMLPPPGTPAALRAPARLRELASRAASGDAPRMPVSRFAAGLRRFGPELPSAAIRGLFERWRAGGLHRASGAVEIASRGPAGLPASPSEAADGDETAPLAAPPAGRASRRYLGRMALAIVMLLLLLGVGAAYWLNADEPLPPLPMMPAQFGSEPSPRTGWELLAPPNTLAADGHLLAPGQASATAGLGGGEADAEHQGAPTEPQPGARRPAARGAQPAGDASRAR